MVNITSFADRDVGQRDKLEDFVLHGEIETAGGLHLQLILVADGAGGGEAGELAARLTGRTIQDHLEVSEEDIIPKLLIEAVEEANRAVYKELQGEGTSTVALAVVDLDDESEFGRLYIAHVGDSHIGLMRDRQLMRLNISHTIANEYYYAGQITADEKDRLANGSYPTRVIGVNPEIVVDIGFYLESGTPVVNAERAFNIGRVGMKLQEGDSVFVASDGLFIINKEDNLPYVHEEEFLRYALDNNVENAVRNIVRYAANRGPEDNVSLAMLFVPSRMRRAVVTNRLSRRQRIGLAAFSGLAILIILLLGTQFFISQKQRDLAQQTQEYYANVIVRLSATATFTPTVTPPFTATPRPAYVDPNQVGWQFFGIHSPLPPVPVLPLQQVSSSDKSFVIVEGENPDQLPRDFHGASVFLIPDSQLEVTFVNNTFMQEHYEQVLYPPTGEFFANNHTFERSSSMVLKVPQRDDMFFHTEAFCVAAKQIPPSDNPQTPDEEKERIAFTCFDGVCKAQLPDAAPTPVIDLAIGQRYLFNITDGELISSGSTQYDEVKSYYDMVVELTGTSDEVKCLRPYLDTDGDGVPYPDDKCEFIPGPADGCPDTDLDGVPDIIDACPEEYGVANLDGCPPLLGSETPDVAGTQIAFMAIGTQTAAALQSTGTAAVLQGSETVAALQSTGTAISAQGSETAAAIQATGTAALVEGTETAALISGTETAVLINGTETASALQATQTAILVNASATAEAFQGTQTANAVVATQTSDVLLGTETAIVLQQTDAASIAQTQTAEAVDLSGTQTAEAVNVSGTQTAEAASPTTAPTVNLSISKSVPQTLVEVGDTVTFTITVSNSGNASASGIVVSDTVPDGYTYVADSANLSGTYTDATKTIQWTINLDASGGTTPSRNLTFDVVIAAPGPYQNTASMTYSNTTKTANATANVNLKSDLSISKSASPSAPNIGDTVTFTITVDNAGPNNATGVTVTDILPDGYTYLTDTPSVGTYDSGTGIWTIGDMGVNTNPTETLTIDAIVLATGNNYTNQASVDLTSPTDPNTSNNTDQVSPTNFADLAITKNSTVTAGSGIGASVTFIITVTNNGPNSATNVVVNDLLPAASYQYDGTDTGSPSQGTYDNTSGDWSVGNLANGATATLRILTTQLDLLGATNTATITDLDQTDPDTTNNSDSDPSPSTDIVVTKSINPATVTIGGTTAFTVTVKNNGPNPATNVLINDSLPSGYTYVSDTASKGSYASGVWTVGNLAVNDQATLEIVATVETSTNYTNQASLDTTSLGLGQTDSNSGNNSDTATPDNLADLIVTKTIISSTPANVGDTVTFQITVTNNGPSDATGVIVQDKLPTGYDSPTLVQAEPGTTYTVGTGVWNIGSLANSASVTLQVEGVLNLTGPYTNTATISNSNQIDINTANNTASITPTTPSTDIAVTKAVDKTNVAIGDTLTFTIEVTNTGVSANNVVINDTLPDGYSYISDTPSSGTYTNGVWDIGNLANGGSVTLDIEVQVVGAPSLSDYSNEASLDEASLFQTDSNAANNSYTTAPTVVTGTDLAVSKSISPSTAVAGDTVTFTITVSNLGPNDATGIVVNDIVPSGYTYVSHSGGTYDKKINGNGAGDWSVGNLSAGGSTTLNIVVSVEASGSYNNTATLTSIDQTDYNSANDSDSAQITLSAGANALALQQLVESKSTLIPPTLTATATVTLTPSITPLPTSGPAANSPVIKAPAANSPATTVPATEVAPTPTMVIPTLTPTRVSTNGDGD